jgi:hypothetical protein
MKEIANKIRRYPTLFGALIGLMVFGSIIVVVNWFPWVDQAWDRNNNQVRAVVFTIGLLVVFTNQCWKWRRRAFFWFSMAVFFLAHTTGVLYYSISFRPLTLGEWIILLLVECFAFGAILQLSRRCFAHSRPATSRDDGP